MACHLALANQDILREIFWHLPPLTDSFGSNVASCTALARCARVCRAFVEPALDGLWSGLPSIVPLLKLFSGYCANDNTPWITGEVTHEEWVVFRSYAKRVRMVRQNIPSLSAVLCDILTRAGDVPFMSCLQELRWTQISPCEPKSILPLLSPYLLRLTMRSRLSPKLLGQLDSPEECGPSLDVLPHRSPYLREFTLHTAHCISLLPLAGCTNLRKLSVFAKPDLPLLDYATVHALASLTHLEDLSVSGELAGLPIACAPFPRLRNLSISGYSNDPSGGGTMLCWIAALSAPLLSHLDIRDYAWDHTDDDNSYPDPRLLDCMAAACTAYGASLRRISYAAADSEAARRPSSSAPASLLAQLRPLLQLRALQTLDVTPCDGRAYELSDADARQMAQAWPRLTLLRLSYSAPHEAAVPSLKALAGLARSCPELACLELPCVGVQVRRQISDAQPCAGLESDPKETRIAHGSA